MSIINDENQVINSLTNYYTNSYSKKFVKKYKKTTNFRVIGMGGSTLGTQTIYNFLKDKIRKKFIFIDNLQAQKNKNKNKNKNFILIRFFNIFLSIHIKGINNEKIRKVLFKKANIEKKLIK